MTTTPAPSVTVTKDGPILIKGVADFKMPDGSAGEAKPMIALCRCGMSANKPFCDGSHSANEWSDTA